MLNLKEKHARANKQTSYSTHSAMGIDSFIKLSYSSNMMFFRAVGLSWSAGRTLLLMLGGIGLGTIRQRVMMVSKQNTCNKRNKEQSMGVDYNSQLTSVRRFVQALFREPR